MPREYKPAEEVLTIGKEKSLVTIRDGRVTYEGTKEKKSYQFTDPEEQVRARVYVELIEKYKYPVERIDTEVYPPSRAPPYPADVVVYEDDEHEKVFIVVETKATSAESEIEKGKKEGLGNANLLGAKYLFVVCGEEEMAYDVKENPSLQTLESKRVPQIPIVYGKLPKYRYKKGGGVFFDLKEASLNELHNKFQRCHDEIWEGGKRDPAVSFDEMSKLMFAKIHDERFTREGEFYKFQIGTNETDFEVARRVKEIYGRAQRGEPGVFREQMELSDERIYKIVEILQEISLSKTDLDAKGRAFEKFLDRYFRGSAGQYFTPRQIVDFMVGMLEPDAEDYVIDPACGSGGFLLYSLKKVREEYGKESEAARDFAIRHIYGIEINDRIARIAMMDMVIHHDGHTNITCDDALQVYEKFGRSEIQPNKYDLVFTNPPFGAVAKEEKILKIFELGSKYKKRKTQKTEILFIERCLDLLRPGGKMGIVLPDGILTNSSLQYVRDFIDKKARILAVVSLPQQTFVPSGSGVKASLVFLQKKGEGEELHDYPIFMAIAEHVGYDATGRLDKNDFPKILEHWEGFKEGERNFSNSPIAFVVRQSELEEKWDVHYYHPMFTTNIDRLKACEYIIKFIGDIITDIRYGAYIEPKYIEKGILFIRATNIKDGGFDLTDSKFVDPKLESSLKKYFLNENDIIIVRSGVNVGDVACVPKQLESSVYGSYSIKFKLKGEINPIYVTVFLNSSLGRAQLDRLKSRSAQPNISIPEIKSIKIPLPPRPIQDRIAEIMEEAYEQRKEKLKEAEDLLAGINDYVLHKLGIEIPEVEETKSFVVTLKDLKEGKRHDPFYYLPRFKELIKQFEGRDDIISLKEITSTIMSGQRPKGGVRTIEAGVPSLGGEHVNADGTIKTEDLKYIPFDFHKKYSKTSVKPLDILVVKDGATTGKVGIVPLNFPCDECNINEHVFLIRVKDNLEHYYVFSFLQSVAGQIQIQRKITGAAQTGITKDVVNSLLIPLPPIKIQKEIAGEVQRRRGLAKRLREEANEILEKAKKCVEWIILGGVEKTRKTIRLIADKLKECYNPEKIILFGSYAWGLPDEDSDIDLLIIRDTEEKPHDRIVNAARIVSPLRKGYSVDIFVITPEELKSRLEIGDQFLQEIISQGEALHG